MIIGFCGYPGVGKDAAAKILCEKYGFVRIAFADPLRECLLKLNPLIMYHGDTNYLQSWISGFGWDYCKKEIPEVRRLLQVFGTEVARELIHPKVWINKAYQKMCDNIDKNIVFTDVRFENEANFLSELGGKIYRIHREGVKAPNDHASEVYDFGIAGEFINLGTLEKLEKTLCQVLQISKK